MNPRGPLLFLMWIVLAQAQITIGPVNPSLPGSRNAVGQFSPPNPNGGTVQVFEATFTGIGTTGWSWALFNVEVHPTSSYSCKVALWLDYQSVTLHDDLGGQISAGPTGWISLNNDPLWPATVHENSKCRIYKQGSSVTMNGQNATVRLAMEFRDPYIGLKYAYIEGQKFIVVDGQNVVYATGWQNKGEWRVTGGTPYDPEIVSVTPASGSSGSGQTVFTAVVRDRNGWTTLWYTEFMLAQDLGPSLPWGWQTQPAQRCKAVSETTANFRWLEADQWNAAVSPPGKVNPGHAAPISNSRCSYYPVDNPSAVALDIERIQLTFRLSFNTTTFSGAKKIHVYAVDDQGVEKWSGPAAIGAWTVTGAPDTTPPVITGMEPIESSTTARIAWDTNEVATTQVFYGTTPAYGQSVSNAGYTLNHTPEVTGLQPNTIYYYEVRSTDPAGNTTIISGNFETSQTTNDADSTVVTSGPCGDGVVRIEMVAEVKRLSSNRVRLEAKSWLSIKTGHPDWRSYWNVWVRATPRLNGANIASLGQQVVSGTGTAAFWWEFNLQQTGTGVYSIAADHGGTSSYCESVYPNQVVYNVYSTGHQIAIARPNRPDYAPTGGPVYFLGPGVDFDEYDGSYRATTGLIPGNPQGATGTPSWAIIGGSQFGSLSCSQCLNPVFRALRKSSACLFPDVVIKLNYGGLESDPFHIFINAPNTTINVADPDGGEWNWTTPWGNGWRSRINYETKSMCNDPMNNYAMRESFGLWISDFPGASWNPPSPNAWFVTESQWADEMSFQCPAEDCTPMPAIPGPAFVKVQNAQQTFWVGSHAPGKGIAVQTNRHQRYTDQGEHEEIVRPVP